MKPNQNLDPLAALNNVTEEELSAIQEEEAAKPRKRKPREGFVFLISFYEAIELMPGRLQYSLSFLRTDPRSLYRISWSWHRSVVSTPRKIA